MSLTKNEILNFSEFCKNNDYFIPIDQLKIFFEYKKLKNLNNFNERASLFVFFNTKK